MSDVVESINELISTAKKLRKGQQLPRPLLLKMINVMDEVSSQAPAQKAAALEALRLKAAGGDTPANLLARVLLSSASAANCN